MNLDLGAFTRDILDPVGVWLGIILAIPIFWTWYSVTLGDARRRRNLIKAIKANPGQKPSILIVDLKPDVDIRPQVVSYCTQHAGLKDIPEDRLVTVGRLKALKPEDMEKLDQDIREAVSKLMNMGTDVTHCFYAGPVVGMALVGKRFANAHQIILYHHAADGYQNWGPLRYDI